jgi:purine-binding chemotaxis protein CheW
MSTRSNNPQLGTAEVRQLTTFYVDGDLFGLEVMKVQEVTAKPMVFEVPLAPSFVHGLVNLRGQIATAVGLREIFCKSPTSADDQMSVVCKLDGNYVSLIVDSIGDVLEVEGAVFEAPPEAIPFEVRKFLKGIYKLQGQLLSVLDLDAFAIELSPTMESSNSIPT